MPTNEEWRKILARNDLSDEEVAEFADGIRNIISRFLDEYFRDEFEQDDL